VSHERPGRPLLPSYGGNPPDRGTTFIKLQAAHLASLLPLNGRSGLITRSLLALLVLFEERDGGVQDAPLHGCVAGLHTAAHPSYPLLVSAITTAAADRARSSTDFPVVDTPRLVLARSRATLRLTGHRPTRRNAPTITLGAKADGSATYAADIRAWRALVLHKVASMAC